MVKIKSARIQKFRLRRCNAPVGIIPEFTISLDCYGVNTGKQQFVLFGNQPLGEIDMLVNILNLFDIDYTYELASQYANVAFLGETPIGISNSDKRDWIIFFNNEYKKISNTQLLDAF